MPLQWAEPPHNPLSTHDSIQAHLSAQFVCSYGRWGIAFRFQEPHLSKECANGSFMMWGGDSE